MTIKADEITKIIRDQIGGYSLDVDVAEVGTVVSVGDGIAQVHGIENVMATEMLEFPHGIFGMALNLEEESVGTVLLGRSFLGAPGSRLGGSSGSLTLAKTSVQLFSMDGSAQRSARLRAQLQTMCHRIQLLWPF